MSASDRDLPFYFGFDSRSRIGCAGLETSFGQMLERASSSRLSDDARRDSRVLAPEARERLKRWMAPPKTDATCNVSAIEDALLKRIGTGAEADAQRIESRLAQLSSVQVRALKLHYSNTSLPFEIDACAVMVAAARRLCATEGEPFHSELREALKGAKAAEREHIEGDAKALFESARKAYDDASEVTMRKTQIDDPREWRR